MSIDPREFRNTLGRFATGVTVVSMRAGDEHYGITVNAFMSISLDPPLVGICIDKRANAHQTLLEVDTYAVNILSSEQEAISNHFAGRPTPEVTDPFTLTHNMPLIPGALAHLICNITGVHDAGDHTLFIGEVTYLNYTEGDPLLYFAGKYAHVHNLNLSE